MKTTGKKKYVEIVEHYEDCLNRYGDSYKGVDWPNPHDAKTRYSVMLDVIPDKRREMRPVSLLDFGCGASHLLDYLQETAESNIDYSGLDISSKYIDLCREKYPDIPFYQVDLLDDSHDLDIPKFDFVIANGVFTEKCGLNYEEMLSYFAEILPKIFALANVGMAFNAMSSHVDWERSDLFHLPFDTLADVLRNSVSRHFAIRQDYDLYEFTCYVYREANL